MTDVAVSVNLTVLVFLGKAFNVLRYRPAELVRTGCSKTGCKYAVACSSRLKFESRQGSAFESPLTEYILTVALCRAVCRQRICVEVNLVAANRNCFRVNVRDNLMVGYRYAFACNASAFRYSPLELLGSAGCDTADSYIVRRRLLTERNSLRERLPFAGCYAGVVSNVVSSLQIVSAVASVSRFRNLVAKVNGVVVDYNRSCIVAPLITRTEDCPCKRVGVFFKQCR